MKTVKRISTAAAKLAELICILMIAGLVIIIVAELINRNLLENSNRATIEICGIQFLWMAFIGLIPLYHDHGLMRLDFLASKTKGVTRELFYFANKLFSLLLGVVMVIAFVAQYPYVSTRFYSTFSFPLAYTIQYIPMCIAGAYIALDTLIQTADHIFTLVSDKKQAAEGRAIQ